MKITPRFTLAFTTLAAALTVLTTPLSAQTKDGVLAEILADIGMAEKKITGLAKAMPQAAWDWRPSAGTRSTAEVVRHIAADNYFMPAILDHVPPAETGVTKEYKTAEAFEKRTMTRDAALAELEKSFAFLKASISATPDDKLTTPVQMFGMKTTNRGMWITTATHLHEHLGQLIAYARSNSITPPWSK